MFPAHAWVALAPVACISTEPSAPTVDAGGDEVWDPADASETAAGPSCDPGSKAGSASGGTFTAKNGTTVLVRVPPGYVATSAHPFVMVYSPCCGNAALLEQFTGLTPDAEARGYVIAYADHMATGSLIDFQQAATLIPEVTGRWCIDPKRIYVTGHSDGGSAAEVLATDVVGPSFKVSVAAIAPSAAGLDLAGAQMVGCPKSPVPVMEMHSKNDQVFPLSSGYGAAVAQWWAQCNACNPTPASPGPDGCIRYTGCTAGAEVQYCQGSGQHGDWPGLDGSIFDFFDRFMAR